MSPERELQNKIENGTSTTEELVALYHQKIPRPEIQRALEVALARRADTPAEILEVLCQREDDRVTEQLTRNPSVPLSYVLRFAAAFPEAFWKNPLLQLLLLEDPSLSMIPDLVLASIASVPGAVEKLWSTLLQREYVLKSVLWRARTSSRVVQSAFENNIGPAIEALLWRPDLTVEMLQRASEHPHWSVRRALADRPSNPKEILARLVSDEVSEVRRCVASQLDTPTDLLDKLSHDQEMSVLDAVVRNPTTSADTLAALFSRGLKINPALFAAHPNAPPELLYLLAEQGGCVGALLNNPYTPAEALEIIAYQKHERAALDQVLRELIHHTGATPDLLRGLFFMGRRAWSHLVISLKTPLDIMERLSQCDDPLIARRAAEALQRAEH